MIGRGSSSASRSNADRPPGHTADRPNPDGHLGQVCHRLGRLPEGGLPGTATDDRAEHRRTRVTRRPCLPRSRGRASRGTGQSRMPVGQGCSAPRREAFRSRRSSMVPLATAQAADAAICSRSSASTSRSGPRSSRTRRATTFPQPSAIHSAPVRSIDGDFRKGMVGRSLDLWRSAIWETRLDMLPPTSDGANRLLHPAHHSIT
jgi:hypothetical protein